MPDPNPYFPTGPAKRSRTPPLVVPPGHVAFRLICHASRIGGVIGKSGAVIKQLQQTTGAKIRVEDALPETPDRVVTVVAPFALSSSVSFEEASAGGEEKEVQVSKAQEGLLRVFERILEVTAESGGGGVGMLAAAAGGVVSCRMLADTSQVGSVIGKGGKVVEKIRKDSGCKIRVLTEKLPSCAGPSDEMVEIEGDVLAVKKGLVAVSYRLQGCPVVDKTRITGSRPHEAVPNEILPDMHIDHVSQRISMFPAMPSSSISYASNVPPLSVEVDGTVPVDLKSLQQEVVYRILCSNQRVGGVIGKGGTIVKALQNESGATITVGASVPECDERLITIFASEMSDSRYSPAQKAVLLVFSRAIEAAIENGLDSVLNKSPVIARLVVPSNQVGCLLGKGGTIVSEMRKATSTSIRIIGPDLVPKCASENDQVVQISGEFSNVKNALYRVTGRLRGNIFSSPNGARTNTTVLNEAGLYGRPRDAAPLGLHPSVASSRGIIQHTDLTQSMDHLGISHCSDGPQHADLTQSIDPLGISHSSDGPPSPRLWTSKTVDELNSGNNADPGRGLAFLEGGGLELGSGSKSAAVTNTTVEIIVPESVIGSVYGENGSNLECLRQISGAKVMVHEPRSGTTDRTVVISGTPDETQAAQSLLQAFLLSGS